MRETHLTTSTDMVATLFDNEQRQIARYLIGVPADMHTATAAEQVIQLAVADGTIKPDGGGMVYVGLVEADPVEHAELYAERPPTIH